DGLHNDEVSRTYQQVARLLDSSATQPTDAPQRLALAEQILHQAANPTAVNQLSGSSSGIAGIETLTYSRFPSRAAQLIADVVTTGQYTPSDGDSPITVSAGSIRPQGSGLNPNEREGDRSYASQLFQTTAFNLHLAQHGLQDRAGLPIRDGDGNRTAPGHVH